MFKPDEEPKQEKMEKIEFTEEEKEIIKVAKEKGIESQEFLQLINAWTEMWQEKVEKKPRKWF